jgi:hypothetical protein
VAVPPAAAYNSDRSDPVPDNVWEDAAKHYDEQGVATRQVAGEWMKLPDEESRVGPSLFSRWRQL